jgi:hypothetical protein
MPDSVRGVLPVLRIAHVHAAPLPSGGSLHVTPFIAAVRVVWKHPETSVETMVKAMVGHNSVMGF